jgi:hypothetical protein
MAKKGKPKASKPKHVLETRVSNTAVQGFTRGGHKVWLKVGKYEVLYVTNPLNQDEEALFLPSLKLYVRLTYLENIDEKFWEIQRIPSKSVN